MRRLCFILVLCAFVATPAIGEMMVKIYDGVGNTAGGEFLAEVLDDSIGIYDKGDFISTFCIETSEYLNIGGTYYVSLSHYAILGRQELPGDLLNDQSARIYNYWLDSLDHIAANADDVQNALWHEEGEGGSSNYLNSIAWDASNVMVMNLWGDAAHTVYKQDLLVRVPVPAAVLIGMLGLAAAGLKLRKFV